MYKNLFFSLAIVSVVVALAVTGMGGWIDMTGRPIFVTKQHAWNDGIFMVLLAIFFVLLSKA